MEDSFPHLVAAVVTSATSLGQELFGDVQQKRTHVVNLADPSTEGMIDE